MRGTRAPLSVLAPHGEGLTRQNRWQPTPAIRRGRFAIPKKGGSKPGKRAAADVGHSTSPICDFLKRERSRRGKLRQIEDLNTVSFLRCYRIKYTINIRDTRFIAIQKGNGIQVFDLPEHPRGTMCVNPFAESAYCNRRSNPSYSRELADHLSGCFFFRGVVYCRLVWSPFGVCFYTLSEGLGSTKWRLGV
jgi:hypothetical protein